MSFASVKNRDTGLEERLGFASAGADQVYCVRHLPAGPARARVLLVGPFTTERVYAYPIWVRWARHLAGWGCDVIRFDYRGTGESTGRFEEQCFSSWLQDTETAAAQFDDGSESPPLVLIGLRAGAIIASHLFCGPRGDALILLDPQQSARTMLTQFLRKKLAEDLALGIKRHRVDRESYIARIESGHVVHVEGYPWTRQLWEDAEKFQLKEPRDTDPRPVLRVTFVRNPAAQTAESQTHWKIAIPRPYFWTGVGKELAPDHSELFKSCAEWIEEAVVGRRETA